MGERRDGIARDANRTFVNPFFVSLADDTYQVIPTSNLVSGIFSLFILCSVTATVRLGLFFDLYQEQ